MILLIILIRNNYHNYCKLWVLFPSSGHHIPTENINAVNETAIVITYLILKHTID